jgi:L-aminopeptidase/D-esterase-like protein
MTSAGLLRLVELSYCQVVMLEPWDAARGRFFVGYRTRHGFSSLLGNGVVDEFRTISGPILVAPTSLLGGIYDAGLRLAENRDVEAPIDSGWPPLTVGVDIPAPRLETGWAEQLLAAIREQRSRASAPWQTHRDSVAVDGESADLLQCRLAGQAAATLIVTDAPLLPAQLERLADLDNAPVTVVVSTGNRLPYVEAGELHNVDIASEARLLRLAQAIGQRLRE